MSDGKNHRFDEWIRSVPSPDGHAVWRCASCGALSSHRDHLHIYSHDNGATWKPGPDACPGRRP